MDAGAGGVELFGEILRDEAVARLNELEKVLTISFDCFGLVSLSLIECIGLIISDEEHAVKILCN